jgi:hypothetical protein
VDAALKVLYLAKKDHDPTENNDAYDWGASLVVAVSDGASTTFESRKWARLLTSSFVKEPQFGQTREQVLAWSARLAVKWREDLTLDGNAPWWDVASAHEGSAATLVGARFDGTATDGGTWECMALGDACFFHVSGGKLVKAFPIEDPEDFDNVPGLICTDREKNKANLCLLSRGDRGTWSPGDRFFLLTDALAEWFLRGRDDKPAPWDILEALDQEEFAARVPGWRVNGLRDDDLTAVVIATSAVVPEISHAPRVPVPEAPEAREAPQLDELDELDEEDSPPLLDEAPSSGPAALRESVPDHVTKEARPRRRPNRHTSHHRRQPRLIPLATQVGIIIVGFLIVFALVVFLFVVMKYL